MANVKEHYDHHLADIYSWMSGDFNSGQQAFSQFLSAVEVEPFSTGKAIDLGAGHGIQSVALAGLGFEVSAIDFNDFLLSELKQRAVGLTIHPIRGDIREVLRYRKLEPELIVCCGDTITHLDSVDEVSNLISDCADTLVPGGRFIISFRDYTIPLTGDSRFIPVKSDANQILTCCVDYDETHVHVTDLLHLREGGEWKQKVSSYKKVRLNPELVIRLIEHQGMMVEFNDSVNRMVTMVARKF